MEVRCGFFGSKNPDTGGKLGVECGNPVEGVHGEVVGGVEVGDLGDGVDSGIGSSGAVDADGFLRGGGGSFFEQVLNGVAGGLGLPAFEGTPVIGNSEFDPHGRGKAIWCGWNKEESAALLEGTEVLGGCLLKERLLAAFGHRSVTLGTRRDSLLKMATREVREGSRRLRRFSQIFRS